MPIRWNLTSAEQAIKLFRSMQSSTDLNGIMFDYLTTPGIQFLAKHLNHFGGTNFDHTFLHNLVTKTLAHPEPEPGDMTMLKSMKRGYSSPDKWESLIAAVQQQIDKYDVLSLVNEYLPEPWSGDVTVYLLCGIRGTGIVLGNEIAIDICTTEFEINGEYHLEEMVKTLAHELHHIAFEEHLTRTMSKYPDPKQRLMLQLLGELFSEGTAKLYLTHDFWQHDPDLELVWLKNMAQLPKLFAETEKVFQQILTGEITTHEEYGWLFDEGMIGDTVGYVICKTIDETLGRASVMDCISDCTRFLPYYHNTTATLPVKDNTNHLTSSNQFTCHNLPNIIDDSTAFPGNMADLSRKLFK